MTTDVAFDSVPKSKLIDGIYGGKMVNSVSKVGELYSDMEFDEEEPRKKRNLRNYRNK